MIPPTEGGQGLPIFSLQPLVAGEQAPVLGEPWWDSPLTGWVIRKGGGLGTGRGQPSH